MISIIFGDVMDRTFNILKGKLANSFNGTDFVTAWMMKVNESFTWAK